MQNARSRVEASAATICVINARAGIAVHNFSHQMSAINNRVVANNGFVDAEKDMLSLGKSYKGALDALKIALEATAIRESQDPPQEGDQTLGEQCSRWMQ